MELRSDYFLHLVLGEDSLGQLVLLILCLLLKKSPNGAVRLYSAQESVDFDPNQLGFHAEDMAVGHVIRQLLDAFDHANGNILADNSQIYSLEILLLTLFVVF